MTTMTNHRPSAIDPIAILREEAIAAAIAHGADRVEELADNLVQRYVGRVGGLQLYMRRMGAVQREATRTQIRARYNGRNLAELAREFNLSTRHVRRYVDGAQGDGV